METKQPKINYRADIIAQNREGQPVLLVEIKANILKGKDIAISQLKLYLQAANINIPFAMLVDLEDIQIFQWHEANLSEPIVSVKTADVLNCYDPEFSGKRIFEPYFRTLVEAWLRDLAYHWKSGKPPASEHLAAIGLLQRLEGGTTQAEAAIGSNTIY
jgi:hypothetical protein